MLNSYTSQCICLFSEPNIKIYGKKVHVHTVYYQPISMNARLSFQYMSQLNKIISDTKFAQMFNRLFLVPKSKDALVQAQEQIVVCMHSSRIVSPALDSHIISQYIKYIASRYNFNQICNKIAQKIIFLNVSTSTAQGLESEQNRSNVKSNFNQEHYKMYTQIHGLIIKIHGRIPREPVRPRKTVQSRILGSNPRTFKSYSHMIKIKQSTGVNPELGTFSVWVQCIT